MADIEKNDEGQAYHLPADEPAFHVPELKEPGRVASVDLIQRLKEQAEAAKHPKKPAPVPLPAPVTPTPAPTPVVPADPAETHRRKPWVWALLALVILGAAGAGAWALTRPKEPAPTVAHAPSATPRLRPSIRPSIRPTPRPTPPPTAKPVVPGATYTVQSGDTLITIGDKLHKDWHAIAAANGNITDPNLIYPGQVLRIP